MRKSKTGKILIILGTVLMIVFCSFILINYYFGDDSLISIHTFDIIGHALSFLSLILIILGIGLSIIRILDENINLNQKYNEIFRNIDISNFEIKEQVAEIKTDTFFIEHIKLLNECKRNTIGRLNYDSIQYDNLNGNDYFYHAFKKLKSDFSTLTKDKGEIMAITFQAIEKGEINEEHLQELKKCTINIYEYFYKEQKNSLLSFFSTVQSIFIYIKQISNKEKQAYFLNSLTLQLTSEELGLLFYNEIRNVYKPDSNYKWLDEINFFSNIEEDALIQPWIQYRFYPNTKFKFIDKNV